MVLREDLRLRAFSVLGDEGELDEKKSLWDTLFDGEDPRLKLPQCKGKFVDVNQALEVARYDIQYLEWRALLLEKVVEVLNPLAREYKSIDSLKKDLAGLQEELPEAHRQVRMSEARVATALDKLAYTESLVNDGLLQDRNTMDTDETLSHPSTSTHTLSTVKGNLPRKSLKVFGPVQPYHPPKELLIPIDCFEEPWVIFCGKDGNPGCVRNTCAHRACPLQLGSVNEGHIQCPYHGCEYTTDGKCEKIPSTRLLNVRIKSLPCFEQEGMIWIWPGDALPSAVPLSLLPPPGFHIHAKFLTPISGLQGNWDPYPIDMEFRPPCMVFSTTGISKPGKLEGRNPKGCATHLHQPHICLHSSRQKTQILYRMSLDFAPVLKHTPFIENLWRHFAEKVLNEDLRLVIGQQNRIINGANVWNWSVSHDKLGVRYRLLEECSWRG
ncbi:hypothetical protein SAY86_004140 [Trapa natans]|uniref:Rieske domain-containing protein n=1 Tax=Trapa natans TaxID=22666 RepID=A0AAN7N609_TRANT|nr:hypothetical protein SAY86_004140 [Trapa natans]